MNDKHASIALGALLLFIILFQISFIPSYEFSIDPAQQLYLSHDFVAKGVFPLHGLLNSQAAYNPPFFVWLYIIPMFISRYPGFVLAIPAIFLNVLAVLLLYKLGARYFSRETGLLAGVIYSFVASGPYFGHASWAQGTLPAFYTILIFLLSRWILEDKPSMVALVLPLVSWIIGIHWGAVLLIGVLVLFWLVFRPRLDIRWLLAGIALSILLWLPFLYFESQRAFVDILAVGPGGVSAAPVPSPLCPSPEPAGGTAAAPDSRALASYDSLLSNRLAGFLYHRIVEFIPGLLYGLVTNFGPFPDTFLPQMLYLLAVLLFFVGLGGLVGRLFIDAKCIAAKSMAGMETCPTVMAFLLLSFALPLVLQSLSPYTPLRRVDICWLYWGTQSLIAAYAFSLSGRLVAGRVVCAIVKAVAVAVLLLAFYQAGQILYNNVSLYVGGHLNPQLQMVESIAQDLRSSGLTQTAIRYDLLRDRPEICWVVNYSALDELYYIGVEHDYLLSTCYGIENTSKVPDGWAEDPDYIVLYKENWPRYETEPGGTVLLDSEVYIVLKVKE